MDFRRRGAAVKSVLLLLQLKGAQVKTAVVHARQAALIRAGQAGDVGVAGAVGGTALSQRHGRRRPAVVLKRVELWIGDDRDDAGCEVSIDQFVRLDEIGAPSYSSCVDVIAVARVGRQIS